MKILAENINGEIESIYMWAEPHYKGIEKEVNGLPITQCPVGTQTPWGKIVRNDYLQYVAGNHDFDFEPENYEVYPSRLFNAEEINPRVRWAIWQHPETEKCYYRTAWDWIHIEVSTEELEKVIHLYGNFKKDLTVKTGAKPSWAEEIEKAHPLSK